MSNESDSADQADESPNSEPLLMNERVLKLEIALENAEKKINALESPKSLWKDRRFLSGLGALPALIASGWILTAVNSAVFKTPYFQPIPFIHTVLGTEEAVKAYVAPNKPTRGDVVEEIKSLFENKFVSHTALSTMNLLPVSELDERDYLDRNGLRVATEEGEIDGHIRSIGGRRQNFNDFFVQELGLSSADVQHTDCESIPKGAESLELNESCVVIGNAFRYSDEFTVMRPRDVNKINFEIFVVSRKMTGIDDGGLTGEALHIEESIRDKFFELRVNAKLSRITRAGVESNFAHGVIAYKFEAAARLTREMEDRTYDIVTISLNLKKYDTLFDSERRDKTFTVFVVPKFENNS